MLPVWVGLGVVCGWTGWLVVLWSCLISSTGGLSVILERRALNLSVKSGAGGIGVILERKTLVLLSVVLHL